MYFFELVDQKITIYSSVVLKYPGDVLDLKCASSPVVTQIFS